MPLFKCQKCNHMLNDNFIPIKCPECGCEALRDANPAEYYEFFTPIIIALRDQHAPSMTRDERNWVKILMIMNPPSNGFGWHFLVTSYLLDDKDGGLDRESILYHRRSIYRDERWLFNRQLKQDRALLRAKGITEPKYIIRKDDGAPAVTDWGQYGTALRVLYSFELYDPHKRPTLWDINHIDLEKIVMEPSEAYQGFLRSWADLFRDEPHPMEGVFPKKNPFQIVDEDFIPDDELPF